MNELSHFFIVGVGRSGTSLLMSMVNAHPEIITPPELHFVNQYLLKFPNSNLSNIKSRLVTDSKFGRLNLNIDEILKPYTEQKNKFSVARLYKTILEIFADNAEVNIVGDKAPKNIENLLLLSRIFPKAYIINLIRDPRDVYLSRTKAKWSSSRSDILQFLAYRAQYSLGRIWGPKLFGKNYLEIHYENLLKNPENELKSVCNLLQVPYNKCMLNFSNSAKELVSPDEISWKKETFGPLLSNNMNKWRNELSEQKVATIESACSPVFLEGFYKLTSSNQSALSRIFINSYMTLLTFIYKQIVLYKNRIVAGIISWQGL